MVTTSQSQNQIMGMEQLLYLFMILNCSHIQMTGQKISFYQYINLPKAFKN